MSSDTGLFPSNGHRIQGRSTESFIDARDVISRLDLKGNEVFVDAGCGDGHATMIAYDMMDDDATIYALDVYPPSIEDMEKDLKAEGITNVIPIQSDIAGDISLDDDTADISLMINVFHHFVAHKTADDAIAELKRITKPGGKIAVMDYKKMDTGYGPPVKFKSSEEEMEEMFTKHALKMVKLDTEVGEDLEDGSKSHYLIVFEK
jgi:ubiquinone/menaquinone biosynthesis C-methylase UbiE